MDEKLYKTVGQLIRNARENAEINQEDLSSVLGLTRTSVSNFERGKQRVQLHTLYQIAVALNVPIQDLLPEPHIVTDREDDADRALIATLLQDADSELSK